MQYNTICICGGEDKNYPGCSSLPIEIPQTSGNSSDLSIKCNGNKPLNQCYTYCNPNQTLHSGSTK